MGFRPPIVGTRLRVADDGEWLTGDVDVRAGAAARITETAAGGILLESPGSKGLMPRSLFIPGTLAAGEVGRFRNRASADGTPIYVSNIDAYLLTAPGAASAADCMAIQVAGSVSGSQQCALSSTDNAHSWDGQDAEQVADFSSGSFWGNAGRGVIMMPFTPTSDINVGSLDAYYRIHDPGDTMKWHILSADRSEIIASTAVIDTAVANGTYAGPYNLETVAQLEQGVTYWVAMQGLNKKPEPYRYTGGTQSNVTLQPGGSKLLYHPDLGAPMDGPVGDYSIESDSSHFRMRLYGQALGVLLDGSEIVVSVVAVGTGGTPGDDCNVSLFVEDLGL